MALKFLSMLIFVTSIIYISKFVLFIVKSISGELNNLKNNKEK